MTSTGDGRGVCGGFSAMVYILLNNFTLIE